MSQHCFQLPGIPAHVEFRPQKAHMGRSFPFRPHMRYIYVSDAAVAQDIRIWLLVCTIYSSTESRVEQSKRTPSRNNVPEHTKLQSMPSAVEPCSCMGMEAVRLVNHLTDIAAELAHAQACMHVLGSAAVAAVGRPGEKECQVSPQGWTHDLAWAGSTF